MKVHIPVYVVTKNLDLHAYTAHETLVNVLQQQALIGLRRYILWEFVVEAVSEDDAVANVTHGLDNTIKVLNPNKEAYFLRQLPKGKTGRKLWVKVKSKDKEDWVKTLALGSEIPGLLRLEKSVLWELHLDETKPMSTEDIMSEIVNSTKRQQGLLANPISEYADIYEPSLSEA